MCLTQQQKSRFDNMQKRANGEDVRGGQGRTKSLISPLPAGPIDFLRSQVLGYPVTGLALERFAQTYPALRLRYGYDNCRSIAKGFKFENHPITGASERVLLSEEERGGVFARHARLNHVWQVSENFRPEPEP